MSVLEPLANNLWLIEGPVVRAYGFPFPTRMAVLRLPDGRLWVWSPVRLNDEIQEVVRSLGEPRSARSANSRRRAKPSSSAT
jgi:hypothetical protein